MAPENYDLMNKYRRLRILYNRIGTFGHTTWYSDWFKHTFKTKLGPRVFVCTIVYRDTPDEILQFYYYEDEQNSPLFVIDINREKYNFNGRISEESAWLAIHELEELSYKELTKQDEATNKEQSKSQSKPSSSINEVGSKIHIKNKDIDKLFGIIPSEPINNFRTIDTFLQFEEGTFYKFELLVRNTDGENILFPEGISNSNKNILIKSWYVDSKGYYEKVKHEMITLADITGARLYVTLDRKDNTKLVQSLIHGYTNSLVAITNNQKPGIKNLSKIFASETSKVENSSKSTKTLMWDVDTKDMEIVNPVYEYIRSKKQEPFTLKTKKGYHIFCYKKFNHQDWLDWMVDYKFKCVSFEGPVAEKDYKSSFRTVLKSLVSVKENELGLIYHPMKNEKPFSLKLIELIEPYMGDFTGYDEEKQGFDVIKAVEDILEDECSR